MKRTVTMLAVAVVAATAGGGLLVGGGAAHAATTPPWEPDASAVGSLTFYDATGKAITSGSTTSAPIAAFVEGSTAPRAGDTKATLLGFEPVKGKAPGAWNGHFLSGSTTYPNASAPGSLGTATLPVVTGAAGDDSVAQLVAALGTTTVAGYQNVFQIRLVTSGAGEAGSTTYDAADIQVSGSTWSEIYPSSGSGATTATTLSVAPASATYGSAVKLTASVTPAAAGGIVEFLDGSTLLKKVAVASGSATYTTRTLAGGTHHISASFVPGSAASYSGSVSAKKTVTIKAASTSVKLKASKSSIASGKALTLTATESPAVAGSVTFKDGSKTLKSVKVSKGKATLTIKALKAGKHTLKAVFKPSKSADYKSSTAKSVTVTVT